MILLLALALAAELAAVAAAASTRQPNIILIVADDLGFHDVSFRGSNDLPTPNIDALAYSGRILDRHYVLPICTPSRTALLTGKYPVRTGMQGFPLIPAEKRSLSTDFTLLPQYLKKLNYSTHLVGKWHLGFQRWIHTPTYRGFDSFFGYYNGAMEYYNHYFAYEFKEGLPLADGIDLRRNGTVAHDLKGKYATELFTRETEQIIRNHNKDKPLFIDLSHLAVHCGEAEKPLSVEDVAENDKTFGYLKDLPRRRLAGAMASLDKSVGRVVKALDDAGMIRNTIIVFIADNGAETVGRRSNAGSNYPLRGQKGTQFEGGVRGAAVVWHAKMKPTDKLHSDYIHITDWIPTFYEAAGGDVSDLDIDGVSQWGRLSGRGRTKVAPRSELLVNSEFLFDVEQRFINRTVRSRSYIDGPWKLVCGIIYPEFSDYLGESGNTVGAKPYDFDAVVGSKTMKILQSASRSRLSKRGLKSRARKLRRLATLPKDCRKDAPEQSSSAYTCQDGCLFNIAQDPCETRDVSAEHPDIVASLYSKLEYWEERTVPQLNADIDTAGDPRLYNDTWMPWEDVPPY